jgi:hypothetical protein
MAAAAAAAAGASAADAMRAGLLELLVHCTVVHCVAYNHVKGVNYTSGLYPYACTLLYKLNRLQLLFLLQVPPMITHFGSYKSNLARLGSQWQAILVGDSSLPGKWQHCDIH